MPEPHTWTLRVRYHECDMQGVVFNANYLAYFDMNITELIRAAFGSYGAFTAQGVDVMTVDAHLSFRASARFDDELTMEVGVVRFGTTSLTTHHRLLRGGEVLVEGELVHVVVDAEQWTKREIPGWAREALRRYAIADPSRPAADPLAGPA